jgi:hypothetical protein
MESATATFHFDLTRDEEWLADVADQDEASWVTMLAQAGLTPREAAAYERWIN